MSVEIVYHRPDVSTVISFGSKVENINVSPDFLIVDSKVESLYRGKLPVCKHVMKIVGGEESKTPTMLQQIWQEMSRAELQRDSSVVVIGGGSVCDVGAFAASTWKRGVGLTLIPTTLLCMVDAALGGKTAINTAGSKNQAGTIYPASEIIVCLDFLQTLPDDEMVNGLAEALKTAVIGDKRIVEYLHERDFSRIVKSCLAVKGEIVAADLEEKNKRRLLNLGHTIGHCIETESDFNIGHGTAVAMGIPIAAKMGGNKGFAAEFSQVAHGLGIETVIPPSVIIDGVMRHLNNDKKTTDHGRIWIIPNDWENCDQVLLDQNSERELLERAWQ